MTKKRRKTKRAPAGEPIDITDAPMQGILDAYLEGGVERSEVSLAGAAGTSASVFNRARRKKRDVSLSTLVRYAYAAGFELVIALQQKEDET